jgi:hypothetical protein
MGGFITFFFILVIIGSIYEAFSEAAASPSQKVTTEPEPKVNILTVEEKHPDNPLTW